MYEFANPLGGNAQSVPVEVARTLISLFKCPDLPDAGPISPQHVTAAWVDAPRGMIDLEFDNGVRIIYSTDTRTGEQYASDMADAVEAGDWEGHLVALRGTTADAIDIQSGLTPPLYPTGPASLGWIEGADLVEMIGHGGQSLADLLVLANALTPPGGPNVPR
jgi:hypothetical protein